MCVCVSFFVSIPLGQTTDEEGSNDIFLLPFEFEAGDLLSFSKNIVFSSRNGCFSVPQGLRGLELFFERVISTTWYCTLKRRRYVSKSMTHEQTRRAHPLNERERRRGKQQKRERDSTGEYKSDPIEAIKVLVTTERRNKNVQIPNGIHTTNRTKTTERRTINEDTYRTEYTI